MSGPQQFVVVVGGGPPAPRWRQLVELGAVVVAADSGVDAALEADLVVHHVVGDLDSASRPGLDLAVERGAVLHEHPADKDATDSELALDLVIELRGHLVGSTGPDDVPRLLVLGGGAGRLDHLVADLHQLAADRLHHFDVSAHLGDGALAVVRPGRPRRLATPVGGQVSVLAVGGIARGVTTEGLRWLLHDADLVPGSTRGMSNEVVAAPARVRVGEGAVVVVEPGTSAPRVADRSTPYDPSPRHP